MDKRVVAIPVTTDGRVGHSWGKAQAIALATTDQGQIIEWRVERVGWDLLHDEGTEGSHHARVARFTQEHDVTHVIAGHMGQPMNTMLTKLNVVVRLGVEGPAREAALEL